MRASLAERAESARQALAALEPGEWSLRLLEESADGRAVYEYTRAERRVIGKFRSDGGGAESVAVLRALQARTPGVLRVPAPVVWLEADGALLTEAAAGAPCRTLDLVAGRDTLVRIGRALADLHRIALSWGAPKRMADHLAELAHPAPEALAAALPTHATGILRALERLAHDEAAWGPLPMAFLHRDFHLRQLFDDGAHITVLDWDDAASGDPAFDVGYFTTYLKTHYERALAEAGIAAFREGYGGDDALWSRIPTYERFNHLRRACRRFRLRDAGWERELERMLARLDD